MLQEQHTCLDNILYSNLYFWDDKIFDKCDTTSDFKQIKQVGATKWKHYIEKHDSYIIISLQMDSLKEKSVVTSYKFMDLMGNFGGFMEVVVLFFAFFGFKVSAMSFKASLVESNYI